MKIAGRVMFWLGVVYCFLFTLIFPFLITLFGGDKEGVVMWFKMMDTTSPTEYIATFVSVAVLFFGAAVSKYISKD